MTFQTLNIKRNKVVKKATLEQAWDSLNYYTKQHFVILGDNDDSRPYWVVDANTAQKLIDAGYERA